jgi:hypothetical protein
MAAVSIYERALQLEAPSWAAIPQIALLANLPIASTSSFAAWQKLCQPKALHRSPIMLAAVHILTQALEHASCSQPASVSPSRCCLPAHVAMSTSPQHCQPDTSSITLPRPHYCHQPPHVSPIMLAAVHVHTQDST